MQNFNGLNMNVEHIQVIKIKIRKNKIKKIIFAMGKNLFIGHKSKALVELLSFLLGLP